MNNIYVNTGADVPIAVQSCVAMLRVHGLQEEGLFRVPGSSNEVDEIKTTLERGKNPFLVGRPANAEAVATCLKLYLRELADPVIPRALYPEFVKIGRVVDSTSRLQQLQQAVHGQLPVAHRELLRELLPFLNLVSQHSTANKMTTSNLALVFGPTLMPSPRDDMAAMLRDSTAVNNIMTALIEHSSTLFPDATLSPAAAADTATSVAAAAEPDPPEDDDDDDDDVDDDSTCPEIERVRAKFDYVARSETELAFRAQEILIVYRHKGPDWCLGSSISEPTNRKFIAKAYVESLDAPLAAAAKTPSLIANSSNGESTS